MGQDAFADKLLSMPLPKVSIVLPTICVMKGISAFDWKRIERNKLKEELDRQLKQLQRSGGVAVAKTLVTELSEDLTNARLRVSSLVGLIIICPRLVTALNCFLQELTLLIHIPTLQFEPNWTATMR